MPGKDGPGWRGAGQVTTAEEFVEFAEAVSPRLRRTAFLLCGDWHTAEDLAQTALAKVFVSWRKIRRQDAAHAYTTRTLLNTYLAHKRLKQTGELLTGWFPERVVQAPAPEERIMLLDALATLPPRGRAVVVLRYWEDLSVEQVADVLGCSPGNVKSLSARALGKLRVVLGEAMAEYGSPGRPPGERHQSRDAGDG
jgi:RNA polymerase sigma-70 factor (sigma-E family)